MPSDPAASSSAPDHLIGTTLANRYEIEARLGEGAMGAVYRARHAKVGRPFAVKVLHSKLLDDDKIAQRFEREAELAGRLSHPNVIGVVDVGETPDGLHYMVMDFAEGEDLAGLLAEAPMPPARIIRLTRQLLEGLFHAHEAGLIHRDFKPENVIVSRNDHDEEVPRIVDFGIAILREGGDSAESAGRLTTNGLVLGTPHYMAPEQAVADPIDHRIDLFALGIVVYEMLCGKLPFDGSGAQVARANLLLDPPAIAVRVPYLEVDPLLEAFARLLMEKKREHRPATARAAREILDLIEKAPAEAAKFLGVAVAASARLPAVTEPQRELRGVVAEDGTNEGAAVAFPTSRPAPVPRPLTQPRVAPQPAAPTRDQRLTTTASAAPLGWENPPRSNRKIALAGLAFLLAAVIALFVIKYGKASDQVPDQTVVMTPVTEPRQPVPTSVPTSVALVEQPKQVAPVVEEVDMPADNVAKRRPPATQPKKPVVAKADLVPAKPVEVAAIPSADNVRALYIAVAGEIKAVETKHGLDAASELWRKYRQIQIQNATATPEARHDASQTLVALRHEAATKR